MATIMSQGQDEGWGCDVAKGDLYTEIFTVMAGITAVIPNITAYYILETVTETGIYNIANEGMYTFNIRLIITFLCTGYARK